MESVSNEQNKFRKLHKESMMEFDYEVASVKFVSEDSDNQVYFLDHLNSGKNYGKINKYNLDCLDYNKFWDSTNVSNNESKIIQGQIKKANIFKRLVSKKKNRFQDENFDLDLSVIAMGYPSTGCESMWRNNAQDIKKFLALHHREVKVYNLCLEKSRIYNKELFPNYRVGLFPFTDHEPCPIKLMLDFCVDICLYLIKHPNAVAAVHCKAGKGRTGVMSICYLIFSGLFNSSDEAIVHYANVRTQNKKGVTISSQIRYIKYFEAFLSSNLSRPYYKMIPKIMKFYINPQTKNIIKNYITDDGYFITKNTFNLNLLRIGPFSNEKKLNVQFASLLSKNLLFPNAQSFIERMENGTYYYTIKFNSDLVINYDLNISVKYKDVKFYMWMNLWYSTLDSISQYVFANKLFMKENKIDDSMQKSKVTNKKLVKQPSFVEMKNILLDFKNSNSRKEEIELSDSFVRLRHLTLQKKNSGVSIESFEKSKGQKDQVAFDSCDNIIQLIDSLSNDSDLNKLIDGVNRIAFKRHLQQFNKDDIKISLGANDLDKFINAKKMLNDFKVDLHFKIIT